ncbi:MAG: hypothetical protein IPM51_16360 [Sphingobacteriaceae bacterium]|nr:hypothetical protein [Sphingobacteriaceae bacterium]
MTQSDKIITTVRQYCLNLFQSGLSTQQSIANGLLNGVEYIVGKQFDNLNDLKDELKQLAQDNLKIKTSGYSKAGHLKQIELERQKYVDFVDNLDIQNLNTIQALPYRRRLSEIEAKTVRQNLELFWKFDGGYWEPLTVCSPKPFYFYNTDKLDKLDYENLIKIISKITNDRIYEITEERLDYEIDISEFDKDNFETIYTDKKNQWIIYLSHEGTIAFGGQQLMDEFDKLTTDKTELKNKW